MNYSEEVQRLSIEMVSIANDFMDAKKKYAGNKYEFEWLLGQYLASKIEKKTAFDKVIILALADKTWPHQENFSLKYKGYVYYKALSIGLEAKLKAIQSQVTSIQSIMKYNRENDGGY